MIFDIPLFNSKGKLHLFLAKSLPFVCDYPHRTQTTLLNIYSKSNKMK